MPRYGYIQTKEDIKFLVLYAMTFPDIPISFDHIVDICTWCDDGFGYFELHEAFQEMVASGHIACEQSGSKPLYTITAMGREAASLLESNLPYTVRESAQASALRVVRTVRRNAAITTSVEQLSPKDLIVSLNMQDVFSIQMHVVSQSQASLLERNFKRDAEKMYRVLLDALINPAEDTKSEEPAP